MAQCVKAHLVFISEYFEFLSPAQAPFVSKNQRCLSDFSKSLWLYQVQMCCSVLILNPCQHVDTFSCMINFARKVHLHATPVWSILVRQYGQKQVCLIRC